MNYKTVFSTIGYMSITEAVLLLLPAAVSFYYGESCIWGFLITSAAAAVIGIVLCLALRTKNNVIYAKDGFAIVSIVWLFMSAVGALPFVISGEIPSYVDAFFETVSGFTTTGASVVDDVEALSHGILFWRSFTHWVGGMGVLVFVMALLPNMSDRPIHIMRAEMPGPVIGKIVPRAKDTAKILYLMYLVLTALEFILLAAGGMSVFDSILHSFGTAGTGGFGIKADSIGGYGPYFQWVIAIFMLLFGINFNLYYLVLIKRFRSALKSTELWSYIGIFLAGTGIITANVYSYYKNNFGTALRHSFFQASSIMTTTGFSTDDFNLWLGLSKAVILTLMIIGACAGSTAGGLKISRVVMLFKMIKAEFHRMLHPHSVSAIRFEGKPVDDATLKGVSIYFAAYALCIVTAFLLISFEPFGIETNLSAVLSCFNNIGPGLGAVGPASSFSAYTDFSKLVLSAAMLLGRLEIYPLLITLSPSTWIRR